MSYPHMAWAAGHALVLLGAFLTFLPVLGLAWPSSKAYRLAFGTRYPDFAGGVVACGLIAQLPAGAVTSWTVVVFKSLGVPSMSKVYLQRAALDENAQYLFLALTWFFQRPVTLAILPYAIFSFFHIRVLPSENSAMPDSRSRAVNFTRQTFLPAVKAGSNSQQTSQAGFPAQLSKNISTFSKRHYEGAMSLVAYIEIAIMIRILLGAITFRNSYVLFWRHLCHTVYIISSLLAPLSFGHFLRFRYYCSQATKNAFGHADATVQRLTLSQACPPLLRSAVGTIRSLIIRYADSVLAMPTQQRSSATRGQDNPAEAHRAR